MFKVILISILLISFGATNAKAYMMKHKDDYDSIDRIRSCQAVELKEKYHLPLDRENHDNNVKIGVIPEGDLIRFNFGEILLLLTEESLTGFFDNPVSTTEIASMIAILFPPTAAVATVVTSIYATKRALRSSLDAIYVAAEELRKTDYNFRITNERCAVKSMSLFLGLKVAMKAIHSNCKVISPTVSIFPAPVNDIIIIIKAIKNVKKQGCKPALAAISVPFAGYFAMEKRMASGARDAMKRARLCGHNWTSWNPTTRNKDQIGLYQRKVKLCVECRLEAINADYCKNTIGEGHDNYKEFCNDNQESQYGDWIDKNLTELLQYRKYREYVYRGAEREDRSGNNRWDLTASSIEAAIDSTARIGIDMKYCIDPTKEYNVDHGDIMKAYYVPGSNANGGYKFYDKLLEERGGNQFGPFAVQKYYYRGTTSSEFNCGKYLQEPRGKVRSEVNGSAGTKKGVWNIMGSNDPDMNQMRQIYRDAYDCCMRKKHGSICVEYDSDYSPDSDSDYDNDDVFDGGDYYVEPNHNIDPDLEDIKEPVYNDNYRICNAEEVCSFGAIDTGNILPLEFDSEYITTTDRDIDSNANNLLCAHTISLCPFDFNIGGATAICNHVSPTDLDIDLDSDQMCSSGDMTATNIGEPGNNNGCQKRENIGTCDNYCQMLNHCVIVDSSSDYSNISINSPYFDKSCFDFKGVSKYSGSSSHWRAGEVTTLSLSDHDSLLPVSSSTINLFPDDITRLTSPIAQCVRETIKNVFLNKAGHTRCLEGNNFGNYDTCPTGQYKWLKGQDLENITNDEGDRVYFSIFKFIQDKLYDIVQVFLILYVMMFGLQILMSEKIIPRDKILNNCLKLGIVLYFATGNAWQTYFFDVVYYISVTFGNIILDLQNASLAMDDSSVGSEEMNRCYFDPALYSSEMQYVSLWDTLDCKLSQYLGLAPGLTSGNLAILIIAGFFTGSYGIYFASLLFTFAIQFFQIIYLTLYIFLSTSIAVIMLIFISPIIMVALLFEKTKTMFNEWLKQLLESATQIIILFSFVSLTIFLFDYFFTGSAKFENNKINCECSCKVKNGLADGSTEKYFIHGGYKKCGTVRGNVVDDSVAAGAIAGGVAGAGAGLMVGGPIGMAAGAAAGAAGGSVAGSVAGGSVEGATTITCKDEFNGGNLDATKDENNILIVDDQRIVINCENIYREGLCNQRDGFEIMDPKADSLICMMRIGSESVGKTSNLAIFGVAAPVLNILLAPDRVITLILTLVKIVMITYIIKIMTSRIGTIASVMWGGKPLPSSISGADIGIKKAFNRTKNLASKTQQLANRGAGKKATEFAKSRSGNSGSSGGESPPKSGGNDSSSF